MLPDSPDTDHPTAPVITDAIKIMRQMISSFLSVLLFRVSVSTGMAWTNTSVSTKASADSTPTIIRSYHPIVEWTNAPNSLTTSVAMNTRMGACDNSAFSYISNPLRSRNRTAISIAIGIALGVTDSRLPPTREIAASLYTSRLKKKTTAK